LPTARRLSESLFAVEPGVELNQQAQ